MYKQKCKPETSERNQDKYKINNCKKGRNIIEDDTFKISEKKRQKRLVGVKSKEKNSTANSKYWCPNYELFWII